MKYCNLRVWVAISLAGPGGGGVRYKMDGSGFCSFWRLQLQSIKFRFNFNFRPTGSDTSNIDFYLFKCTGMQVPIEIK